MIDPRILAAGLVLAFAAPGPVPALAAPATGAPTTAAPSPAAVTAPPACPDPTVVPLAPTRPEVAGSGEVALVMAGSPYGVAVSTDGRYRTRITVRLEGLLPRPGATHVVWAATPSLGEVARLGTVESGAATIDAVLEWNQFLVFVTAETTPGERWEGPILFTAMSPSGKMHPKAGHGIFESYSYLC